MAASNKEIIDLLLQSYCMELETVMNYLANSTNLDGVRAEEIKKSLGGDVTGEIAHAQQLANRIKQLGGHIPGSASLKMGGQIQPVTDTTDVVGVIKSVIAAEEAVAQSGLGRPGDFPGPLFMAVPPVELEWVQKQELAASSNGDVTYQALLADAARHRHTAYHAMFLFGSVAGHIADHFGTKGSPISLSTACSSGATAIQMGVEAIRRGDTEAALCIGTDGSVQAESLIRFSLL